MSKSDDNARVLELAYRRFAAYTREVQSDPRLATSMMIGPDGVVLPMVYLAAEFVVGKFPYRFCYISTLGDKYYILMVGLTENSLAFGTTDWYHKALELKDLDGAILHIWNDVLAGYPPLVMIKQ